MSKNYHNPFIHIGVALTPVISNCPPKVFASFLSFPSNFSLSFSFMATVLCSNLLLTYEYLIVFSYFIFSYFFINKYLLYESILLHVFFNLKSIFFSLLIILLVV